MSAHASRASAAPDKITTCVRFSKESKTRLYAFFAGVDLVATTLEKDAGIYAIERDPGLPHHCRALAAGAVTLTLITADFDFLASEYAPRGALRRADLMDPVL